MKLLNCGERRLRAGLVVAAALACVGLLPADAGALSRERNTASFEWPLLGPANYPGSFSLAAERGVLQFPGALDLAADGMTAMPADIYRARGDELPMHPGEHPGAGASFYSDVRPRHGGLGDGLIGNSRPGDDELGGDDRGRCDDGCVNTSAVPEPASAGLMLAGVLAVIVLVGRRRRRGAIGATAAR